MKFDKKKVIICAVAGIVLLSVFGGYWALIKAPRRTADQASYEQAEAAFLRGDYEIAADMFRALGNYRDAQARLDVVLYVIYTQAETAF